MTQKERIEVYKKRCCINCKHNKEDLCSIRVFKLESLTVTRCIYYERKNNYNDCMKRKCQECKKYNKCFEYKTKKGGNDNVSKSNR